MGSANTTSVVCCPLLQNCLFNLKPFQSFPDLNEPRVGLVDGLSVDPEPGSDLLEPLLEDGNDGPFLGRAYVDEDVAAAADR